MANTVDACGVHGAVSITAEVSIGFAPTAAGALRESRHYLPQ